MKKTGHTKEKLKIIGNHPEIRNVRRRIRRVAPTDLNVLIYGEAGTEKDLAAMEIHRKSLRSANAFIFLNCDLLHEKGEPAADNFLQTMYGKASGGTLYLESVEDMPVYSQKLLYRLLTPRQKPVARYRTDKPLGIRIIASSGHNISESEDFNKKLMILLTRYVIAIVPLRKRKSDLPLLFDYYYSLEADRNGFKEKPAVPDEVINSILAYEWWGNTEELRNTVTALLEMSSKETLTTEALPFVIRDNPLAHLENLDYHEALALVDEHLIRKALEQTGWNQTQAARALGMTEGNIRLKIKKYGIRKEIND